MKISAAFVLLLGLTGCVSDYGLSYDCSSEGKQKPVAFDNGAGVTWSPTNTTRWYNPRGGMAVADDPTFEGSN
jgi:hypothetical protein